MRRLVGLGGLLLPLLGCGSDGGGGEGFGGSGGAAGSGFGGSSGSGGSAGSAGAGGVQCVTPADCTDEAKPLCVSNRCVQCQSDAQCPELLELCIDNVCQPQQGCTLTEAEIAELCEIDLFCQELKSFDCADQRCVFGPRDCDDGDICTSDRCSEQDQACVSEFGPEDSNESGSTECGDGIDNDCDGLTDQQEVSCGGCAQDTDCDDNNLCTQNLCVNNACEHPPISTALACDDGDSCTQDDACGDGVCSGAPLDADDDGYGPVDCGGEDCDDLDPARHPGNAEAPGVLCNDNIDNDCDMRADRLDAGCHQLCLRGWCWSNPQPHGWSQTDATRSKADGHAWFVGQQGVALRWDGTTWAVEDAGVSTNLEAVASTSTSLWVAGLDGFVGRRTNGAWTTIEPPADVRLRAIGASSDSNVWVGADDGEAHQWNGASWSRFDTGNDELIRALAVDSGGGVWAATSRAVRRFSGGMWTEAIAAFAYDVILVSDSEVFATMEDGVRRYDGSSWTLMTDSPPNGRDLWATSASDIWVVNRWDDLFHYDGAAWTQVGDVQDDQAVIAGVGSDVWIGARAGLLFLWDGTALTRISTAGGVGLVDERQMNGVFARSETEAWVPGEYGVVFQWDGARWTQLPKNNNASNTQNTEHANNAVWATGPADVFLVGQNNRSSAGFLEHWDGNAWTTLDTQNRRLTDIWGSSSTDVWFVGQGTTEDAILRWNGSAVVGEMSAPRVDRVVGTGPNDVWFAAGNDVIYHDGSGFEEIPLPCTEMTARDISIADLGEPWVLAAANNQSNCAAGGYLYRRQGSSWVEVAGPGTLTGSLAALWLSSPTNVWVLSNPDLLHYDGNVWTVTPRGAVTTPLRFTGIPAASGSEDAGLWGVNSPRSILYREP